MKRLKENSENVSWSIFENWIKINKNQSDLKNESLFEDSLREPRQTLRIKKKEQKNKRSTKFIGMICVFFLWLFRWCCLVYIAQCLTGRLQSHCCVIVGTWRAKVCKQQKISEKLGVRSVPSSGNVSDFFPLRLYSQTFSPASIHVDLFVRVAQYRHFSSNFWTTFLENDLTEQLKKSTVENAVAILFPLCFSCFVLLRRSRENLTKPFSFYLFRTCSSLGATPSVISLAWLISIEEK